MRYARPLVRLLLIATISVTIVIFVFGKWLGELGNCWVAVFGLTATPLHVLVWVILILLAASFLGHFRRTGKRLARAPKRKEVLLVYEGCWFLLFVVGVFIGYGVLDGIWGLWLLFLSTNYGVIAVPIVYLLFGIFVPFLVGYLSVHTQPPPPAVVGEMGELLKICSDNPIETREQDELVRKHFVNRLYNLIDEYEGREPLVIGMNGRWGQGKSSVLNLLKEKVCAQGNAPIVVTFNPWYFPDEASLTGQFFKTVALAIADRQVIPGFNKRINSMVRLLQSLTVKVGPFSVKLRRLLESLGMQTRTPDEIGHAKHELKVALQGLRQKVVLLVDDIDRLTPGEAAHIFKLVRLCADFPKFVYVLSFDRDIACRLLERANIPDPSGFLQKIVQIDVRLPDVDKQKIDDYVKTGVLQVLKTFDMPLTGDQTNSFHNLRSEHLSERIRNLRDAKKLIASLVAVLPQVKGEVNTVDTIALEALRLFERSVWDDMADSPEFYVLPVDTASLTRRLVWGLGREKEVLQEAQKHLEQVLAQEDVTNRAFARGIVELLFPAAADALGGQSSSYEHLQADYDRNQRVALSDYLKKYLQQHVPVYVVSDEKKASLVRLANESADIAESSRAIAAAFGEHARVGLLYDLLQKLINSREDLKKTGDEAMVRAVCEYSDRFSHEPRGLQDSDMDRARVLLYAIANKYGDTGKIQQILQDAVRESKSLYFASSIILWCEPERNRVIEDFGRVDVPKLKELYEARFREEYVTPNKDIFAPEAGSVRYLIFPVEDSGLLTEYVLSLFTERSSCVGRLLLLYATDRYMSQDHRRWGFQYDDLKGKFDTEKLYAFAKAHKDEAYENDDEKWAVEKFLELHEKSKESQELSKSQS